MAAKGRFRIFLAALALAGSLLVYLATSTYGPGLSTDGARYLSTAESIARGDGIVDYLGLPLINWPPLYPIILAGLNVLTGIDVFILGQIVNIVAFGAIIWLAGIFFERSLPGNYTFAVLASLIVTSSLPFIEVSANIASDPLFMICVLLFLMTAQDHTRTGEPRSWWALVAITIAASFLRYAGLALIISGTLIVLLARELPSRGDEKPTKESPGKWRRWLRFARNDNLRVLEAATFGFAAGAPILAWAIFHNYRLGGTILGSHRPAYAWGNFLAAVEKMAGWFVPETLLRILPPLLLFAVIVVLVAARSSRKRWQAFGKHIFAPARLPSAVFFAVYGAMLVFAISYPEHHVPGSQRLHAVLLPTFLVLAVVTAQEFFPPGLRKSNATRNLLLAIFALWLLFPLYRVQNYVRASLANGDVSYYNLYNTGTLRESDIVAELQSMELNDNERIYSNNEAAAWFYLRRRIYRLPRLETENQDPEAAILEFEGWPAADGLATLIWFERELDYKELVPRPEQLAEYIKLIPIFTGRYGDIYLMDVELAQ